MTGWRSRVVAAVLALACILVAAAGLKLSEPDTSGIDYVTVPGRPLEIDGGELTVTRVRAGSKITVDHDSAQTPGLFVVVTARLAAPGAKLTLRGARVVGGGRTYSDYIVQPLAAEAGFVSTCDWVFEVDPDHLDGLRLQASEGEIIRGVPARAVVDLGITTANQARWRSMQPQTLEIEEPSTKALP